MPAKPISSRFRSADYYTNYYKADRVTSRLLSPLPRTKKTRARLRHPDSHSRKGSRGSLANCRGLAFNDAYNDCGEAAVAVK